MIWGITFFAMLLARGVPLAAGIALPDHHDFERTPLALPPDTPVLCTEKDAVKLWRSHPQALAVPLQTDLPPDFLAEFDARLDAALAQRLSSANPRT